ncbi:MAG: hypothetical protein ACYDCO_23775 [Armatimonadota bacterium]
MTIPRLLDDMQGTGDYLYRVYPFRMTIVDIDGKVAYHSANGQADHDNSLLTVVIGKTLDGLLANKGKMPAATVAKARADQVGKRAAGLWLPRVGYFTPGKSSGKGKVEIVDARGYVTEVPRAVRDELQHKRGQVVRLFTPGVPAPKKPVVLAFVNGSALPGAAALQAWYAQARGKADFYLVYADASTAMPKRAQAATAYLKSAKLTLPCLLDNPENDVTFAYGGQFPRLVVLNKDNKGAWTVKYISAPGAAGFTKGIESAKKLLGK